MKVLKTIEEAKAFCRAHKNIGFVPTMGYLHTGHLSLVDAAKKQCKCVVVSIYVNPTQFGKNEDLSTYPKDLDNDFALLKQKKVDAVFCPTDEIMYPNGFSTTVAVSGITSVLCGKSRPTHFAGVTLIVSKLINIVNPDFMFMGQKDFQQLTVLKQMVADLNFDTQIIGCPIVREPDGLALSSRNKYLSTEQRKNAVCLYQALLLAQFTFSTGATNSSLIIEKMQQHIEQKGFKIDYIKIMNEQTLTEVEKATPESRVFVAAFAGNTRLIDNMRLS